MQRLQPRVSRETRLLLGIVVISLASLWLLARLRFPDQPRNPNPVPPVLAQFSPPSPFEAMATAVAELETKVGPTLTRVSFRGRPNTPVAGADVRLGARLEGGQIIVGAPAGEAATASVPAVAAVDRSTGLATLLDGLQEGARPLTAWRPARAPSPRFLIVAEPTREGVSFRPVFIGAFMPGATSRWPGPVWRVPSTSGIADGALLFTDDGLFAGVMVVRGGERTLVPADTLAVIADRLAEVGPRQRGVVGVTAQALTPLVAAALGVERGVVVTWVDPAGVAAGLLRPLDVVDAVWGQPLTSIEQWDADLDRLEVDGTLALRVRRAGGEPFEVTLTAGAPPTGEAPLPFGAQLRSRPGVGSDVLRVEPQGAAARAGLVPGDMITAVMATTAPTPAEVTRAYAAHDGPAPLALAVSRGGLHLVVALEKTR